MWQKRWLPPRKKYTNASNQGVAWIIPTNHSMRNFADFRLHSPSERCDSKQSKNSKTKNNSVQHRCWALICCRHCVSRVQDPLAKRWSGQSSKPSVRTKLSRRRTELKRWTETEICWNKKRGVSNLARNWRYFVAQVSKESSEKIHGNRCFHCYRLKEMRLKQVCILSWLPGSSKFSCCTCWTSSLAHIRVCQSVNHCHVPIIIKQLSKTCYELHVAECYSQVPGCTQIISSFKQISRRNQITSEYRIMPDKHGATILIYSP